MRNFQRELAVGCWVTSNRNCAIPKGNRQSVVGSLVVEIVKFLEGNGSLLLGVVGEENYTEVDRLAC